MCFSRDRGVQRDGVICRVVVENLQDGVDDGDHHGGGGRVGDPHRQEHRWDHEPKHQPVEDHSLIEIKAPLLNLFMRSAHWR